MLKRVETKKAHKTKTQQDDRKASEHFGFVSNRTLLANRGRLNLANGGSNWFLFQQLHIFNYSLLKT